ncbi:low molecular weight protein arginine phosphatase [Paenibacillus lutrae]|uniref:Low molecular weight protein arginine phosphatase n=1 Tax=Paenibacillus lutrae TaxID=2078573 RepID=A0A7X3FLI5_9BACL|nr:low molecular weight protein arginine phosphatase [Paenibacillus lutrae]MVP01487.1 low molecular weight protein arginine phosphatase [Paenibacillus lutrae]
MKHILFVCTGNTCRSPLAEGMLKQLAGQENLDIHIRSAGVYASDGTPISQQSSSVLREKGCEASITSRLLRIQEVQWADLILTMTNDHKRGVVGRFPEAAGKTFSLKEYVEDDPSVLAAVQEHEQLIAEFQVKVALSEPVTQEEKNTLLLLEKQLPDYDISDPYGGSLSVYRRTAAEIEEALLKLISRLKQNTR